MKLHSDRKWQTTCFFIKQDWCGREEEGKGRLNLSSILLSDRKWQNTYFFIKRLVWQRRRREGKEESFFEMHSDRKWKNTYFFIKKTGVTEKKNGREGIILLWNCLLNKPIGLTLHSDKKLQNTYFFIKKTGVTKKKKGREERIFL